MVWSGLSVDIDVVFQSTLLCKCFATLPTLVPLHVRVRLSVLGEFAVAGESSTAQHTLVVARFAVGPHVLYQVTFFTIQLATKVTLVVPGYPVCGAVLLQLLRTQEQLLALSTAQHSHPYMRQCVLN